MSARRAWYRNPLDPRHLISSRCARALLYKFDRCHPRMCIAGLAAMYEFERCVSSPSCACTNMTAVAPASQ